MIFLHLAYGALDAWDFNSTHWHRQENSQPSGLLFKWINYKNHSQISHTLKLFSFCAFHVKSNEMKTNKQRNILFLFYLFFFLHSYKNFFFFRINFKLFWLWPKTLQSQPSQETLELTCTKLWLQKKCATPTVNKGFCWQRSSVLSSTFFFSQTKLHLWYFCIFIDFNKSTLNFRFPVFLTKKKNKKNSRFI